MNTSTRWYFVDALRILAFALLVPYHVGMYYVSWGWHVKSAQLVPALEPLMRASNPWRMSLLFLLAGTALALMLASARGQSPWLGARLKRLGWPLLFGIAVVVPPQAFFEVQRHGYGGSYLDFLQLYFTAYGGFCQPGKGCLILPTWNHLWFLVYLIVYTLLLVLVLRRWPQLPQRLGAIATRLFAHRWAWLVLPVAFLVLTRLLLRDRFPITHALVDDFYNHSQSLMLFALGLGLAHARAAWRRFEALRWLALGIAVAAWLAMIGLDPGRGPLGMLVISLQQWCAIVAACGFAHRHLNRDSAWRRYLTDAMLPLYLLHQTVIILLAMALRPLALAPAVEGPLLVLLTFGSSLAGYEAARRVRWLRPLVGLAPLKPPRAPAALATPA